MAAVMAPPQSATALIENLDALKARLIAEDNAARKEALMLSKMLTTTLIEPADTAVEAAFSASIPRSHESRILTVFSADCPNERQDCRRLEIVRVHCRKECTNHCRRVGHSIGGRGVVNRRALSQSKIAGEKMLTALRSTSIETSCRIRLSERGGPTDVGIHAYYQSYGDQRNSSGP